MSYDTITAWCHCHSTPLQKCCTDIHSHGFSNTHPALSFSMSLWTSFMVKEISYSKTKYIFDCECPTPFNRRFWQRFRIRVGTFCHFRMNQTIRTVAFWSRHWLIDCVIKSFLSLVTSVGWKNASILYFKILTVHFMNN